MRIIYIHAGNTNLNLPDSLVQVVLNKLYLECLTSEGLITISLPKISRLSQKIQAWGFHIYVADSDRNATVNNITIVAAPGDVIYGAASAVIAVNGGAAEIFVAGYTTWGCLLGPVPLATGGVIKAIYFKTIAKQNDYVFDGTSTPWNPGGLDLVNVPISWFISNGLTATPAEQYIWVPATGTLSLIGTVYANVPSGLFYQQ